MKKITRDELLVQEALKKTVSSAEDCEHDPALHRNLKPHKGKPEYDPTYKVYREDC